MAAASGEIDLSVVVPSPSDERAKFEAAAATIVCRHRPDWTGRPLNYKLYTAGHTNQVLSVWPADADDDRHRLIIRINGHNTQHIIDRSAELRMWRRLAAAGCASQLYGRFGNGVVYEYKPGVPLTIDSVRQPHLCRLVAESMARLHSVVSQAEAAAEAGDWLWNKLRHFIDILPDRFDDAEKQKRFADEFPSKSEFLAQLNEMRANVEPLCSRTVLCHNDLLLHNIIYDQTTDAVHFIDYEYAAFNYQAYDIANHFVEYDRHYPDEVSQQRWLGHYLTVWHAANSLPAPTHQQVHRLRVQVPHFFWCIWSILQAKHSDIDFDFLGYGIRRFVEYKRMRSRFASLIIASVIL